MTSPKDLVLAAMGQGCGTRSSISEKTGLPRMLVDAILDHLEATGELTRHVDAAACGGACASCRTPGDCHDGRGLVTLKLTRPSGISGDRGWLS